MTDQPELGWFQARPPDPLPAHPPPGTPTAPPIGDTTERPLTADAVTALLAKQLG